MRRAALIVNPRASRVDAIEAARVQRTLESVAEVDVLTTAGPGHATELARLAVADGTDAIVVFAGDGGFNEVLNGASGGVRLGFVPGGGTSVLPRALGLPRDPVAAARQVAAALAGGRSRRISLGRVNGRRFGFSAGVGLDAELVRRVDALGREESGRRPGDLAFAWTAVEALAERRCRFEPVLEVRGLGRAAFALVANADPYTYVGRVPLRIASRARFELGLDVIAPRRVRLSAVPRFVGYVLAGRGQYGARDVLSAHDVDRVELVCDSPLPLQVDGEDLGDVVEAVFEAERDAVSVLV
jgi:diacylglycerol kinase family enzyme